MKAIIYLMHSNDEQMDLWLHHLNLESIEVVNISPTNDIVELIEQIPIHSLPSLILIEVSIQVPNSNLLQASKLSRWCRENQASIKIVLLSNRQEIDLTNIERRWATRQGAACILPRLEKPNLISQLNQVYEHLNLGVPVTTTSEIREPPSLVNSLPQAEDSNKILILKKDFNVAINHIKEVIQDHKDSVDSSPVCEEIYTYFKDLEQIIQGLFEDIAIQET